MDDLFEIGGEKLTSRLFIGTGKYRSDDLIPKVAEAVPFRHLFVVNDHNRCHEKG